MVIKDIFKFKSRSGYYWMVKKDEIYLCYEDINGKPLFDGNSCPYMKEDIEVYLKNGKWVESDKWDKYKERMLNG